MSPADRLRDAFAALGATAGARLRPALEPLQARYEQLQPRERVMVAGLIVVFGLLLPYLLLWKPFASARVAAEMRLQSQHQLALQLEHAAGIAPRLTAQVAAPTGSLLTVVDQASKTGELGKPLSRLQPDGDTQVHAWVEDVDFDHLMQWLYGLQTRYGIRVDSLQIERQPTPGLVNARLTLVRGG
jgi:general secretion pathway protein M